MILSYIMRKAMNRSVSISVDRGADLAPILRGRRRRRTARTAPVQTEGSADDAAAMLEQAEKGYHHSVTVMSGVAQAHVLREMGDKLKRRGGEICHPPCCRTDARHMNVLLAEANVPYDEVSELRISIRNLTPQTPRIIEQ
jgi:NAD(P) transhydrogenase subunit beta